MMGFPKLNACPLWLLGRITPRFSAAYVLGCVEASIIVGFFRFFVVFLKLLEACVLRSIGEVFCLSRLR